MSEKKTYFVIRLVLKQQKWDVCHETNFIFVLVLLFFSSNRGKTVQNAQRCYVGLSLKITIDQNPTQVFISWYSKRFNLDIRINNFLTHHQGFYNALILNVVILNCGLQNSWIFNFCLWSLVNLKIKLKRVLTLSKFLIHLQFKTTINLLIQRGWIYFMRKYLIS